jgi:hypothetical protein
MFPVREKQNDMSSLSSTLTGIKNVYSNWKESTPPGVEQKVEAD